MFRICLGLLVLITGVAGPVAAQLVEIERNGATKHRLYRYVVPPTDSAVAAAQSVQKKIDYLGRGGVDVSFQGPAQASIQLVRLRIGEPGSFNLPLYFFVSPAGDVLGGDRKPNELTAATLVNPLGGTLNLSVNKTHKLVGKPDKYTSLKLAYQASGKLLGGDDLNATGRGLVTVVGFGDIGLLFQTGAWPEDRAGNTGVFWIQGKLGATLGSKDKLQELFGPEMNSSVPSWSIDAGIEINNYLNLKFGVSKAFGVGAVPVFDKPFAKFAFDFKPRK